MPLPYRAKAFLKDESKEDPAQQTSYSTEASLTVLSGCAQLIAEELMAVSDADRVMFPKNT